MTILARALVSPRLQVPWTCLSSSSPVDHVTAPLDHVPRWPHQQSSLPTCQHIATIPDEPPKCDTPHSALVLLRHIQYCEGVCCVGGGCWSQAGQTRTTDVGYRFFILSVRAESSTLSQGQAIVCRCSGTTCLGGASPTRLFSMKSGR